MSKSTPPHKLASASGSGTGAGKEVHVKIASDKVDIEPISSMLEEEEEKQAQLDPKLYHMWNQATKIPGGVPAAPGKTMLAPVGKFAAPPRPPPPPPKKAAPAPPATPKIAKR
uniref:Uncharacterized protein n=1 Tax=Romanomermis culicivorax TaxID=13658 RepID=A0A915KGN3_ROMCU